MMKSTKKIKEQRKKEEVWYDEREVRGGKSGRHEFDNTKNVGPIS